MDDVVTPLMLPKPSDHGRRQHGGGFLGQGPHAENPSSGGKRKHQHATFHAGIRGILRIRLVARQNGTQHVAGDTRLRKVSGQIPHYLLYPTADGIELTQLQDSHRAKYIYGNNRLWKNGTVHNCGTGPYNSLSPASGWHARLPGAPSRPPAPPRHRSQG